MLVWKPFELAVMNRIELFNELSTLSLCYVLFLFSDANHDYIINPMEYDICFVVILA